MSPKVHVGLAYFEIRICHSEIGSIDADITLVNERLDKSQGMRHACPCVEKYEGGMILM